MNVSRGGGNPAAAVVFLPAVFVPLMNNGYSPEHIVILVFFGMIFIAFVIMAMYQRRTPLMKIEEGSLVYFGASPLEKKRFPLAEITRIKFFHEVNFWRSGRLLAIETNSGIHRLWLPGSPWVPADLRQMSEALQLQFQEKYSEVKS